MTAEYDGIQTGLKALVTVYRSDKGFRFNLKQQQKKLTEGNMAKKMDLDKLYQEGYIDKKTYETLLEQSMSNKDKAFNALSEEEKVEFTRMLDKMTKRVQKEGLVANFYCHKAPNTK